MPPGPRTRRSWFASAAGLTHAGSWLPENERADALILRGELTPQETHVAGLAREGLSNPEIGPRLFISPKTVEYHLHKVFTKLAISSRTELQRVLPGEVGHAQPV